MISNTPLGQLRAFLTKNYNAKPDTPIQAIIWEEIKGKRPDSEKLKLKLPQSIYT